MGIKLTDNKKRIVITGADAVQMQQHLTAEGGKAFKIEYANGFETDYKPILTISLVENDKPR